MSRRIVLAGGYGYGNVGDHAIGLAICALLREIAPDLEIVLLGGHPSRFCRIMNEEGRYLSLRSPARIASIIRVVRGSDAVLIGGGGLLQDRLPHFYRPYCLLATMANVLRKPVMFYATGVCPPRTRTFRETMRFVLKSADIVTVRDQFSADALADAGIHRSTTVTPDPAITLRPPLGLQRQAAESPLVGVSLRPWFNHPGADAGRGDAATLASTLARCLDRVVERTGATLLFFPMHFGTVDDDQRWQTQVLGIMRHARAAKRVALPSPRGTQAAIAGCDIVLGMRLHANVLAAAAGVPSIAFAYDPKVLEFMRNLGCEERALDIQALDPDDVAARAADLLANRQTASQEIRLRVELMSASARSCARMAMRLAGCTPASEEARRVVLEVGR